MTNKPEQEKIVSGDWWFSSKDFKIGELAEPRLIISDEKDRALVFKVMSEWCAQVANARLKAERDKAPVIFQLEHGGDTWFSTSRRKDFGGVTHRARIEGITEL